MRSMMCRIGLAFAALGIPSASLAQWPADPAVNLAVATGPEGQFDQRLAPAPNGGVWIGWFQSVPAPVNFELRVQRLDRDGVAQLAPGGIVVSNERNNTALFNWSFTSDTAGNAYLAFSDERNTAGVLDISVQKVLPDGSLPWGSDGINLSNNPDFEPAPAVCVALGGDVVVAWARDPSSGNGDLRVQRLAPDGMLRFAAGGLVVPNTGANQPGFVRLVPSFLGDVIVVWLRSTATFSSPRHIWAQAIDEGGNSLWNAGNPVVVLAQPVPIGYFPEVISDDLGGALIAWNRGVGAGSAVGVQRLLASGALGFPAATNGLDVSTDATRFRYGPSVTFKPSTSEITVFFDERSSNQAERGVYGQRFDSAGNRMWGPEGKVIVPLSQDNATGRIRHRDTSDNGAIVTYFVDESFGSPSDTIKATRVDASGDAVWDAGGQRDICTVLSGKDDPELLPADDDALILAWTDGRDPGNGVYAQRLAGDGTLGPPPPGGCPGDANGDLMVDFGDIASILSAFGADYSPGTGAGDADGNGLVDFGDITATLASFGVSCR